MAGEPQYSLSEAYPDEQFLALLERACTLTELPQDELLFEFGVFTAATTFARRYSLLFKSSTNARDFLLTVETPIHEVVREALPDARPPELAVTDLGEEGLEILYTSPRRICAMLRGLVEDHPQIDDVITYERSGLRGIRRFAGFLRELRRRRAHDSA